MFVSLLQLVIFSSCNTSRYIPFSKGDWNIQEETGRLVSADSVFHFIIGNEISPSNTTVIGGSDSVDDGIRRYLTQICNASKIRIDSILCYIPEVSIAIVAVDESYKVQPSSVVINIHDNPYTTWVRDDDVAEGRRGDEEVYSHTLIDKRNKSLIVVDRMTYKKHDIAFIKIVQTNTKKARNMNVPSAALRWADVTNPRNIDAISYWIMSHRDLAIKNFRLGN